MTLKRPFADSWLLRLTPVVCSLVLASCVASKPSQPVRTAAYVAPPAPVTCLGAHNQCLDRCNRAYDMSRSAASLGSLLAKPKTEEARRRVAQSLRESEAEGQKTRTDCREGCDTESDMCRRRN
jgi:hypothetical protein